MFSLFPRWPTRIGGWAEGAEEFGAGVRGEDFVEPGLFRSLILAGEDFNDISVFELFVEIGHFAVDFDADNMIADLRVETVGEI